MNAACGADPADPEAMPPLSVVLIALGEDPDLPPCVAALKAAAPPRTQLIVVQNDVEGAPCFELDLPPDPWIRRRANPGFTGAFHDGLRAARAPLVLSLTPDARLRPDALRRAMATLEGEPRAGAVAFRLEREDGGLLDSAGIRLGFFRRAKDRGGGRPPRPEHEEAGWVDAACMACALFRRDALEGARDGAGDVLDQRFFVYKEDVDLGWRLLRAGTPVRYEPRAVATHARGWKQGLAARRQVPLKLRRMSLRNRLWTVFKNESRAGLAWRGLPLLLHEALVFVRLLTREPGVLPAYLEALRGFRACRRRYRLGVSAAGVRSSRE